MTGVPGKPLPPGWDMLPGGRVAALPRRVVSGITIKNYPKWNDYFEAGIHLPTQVEQDKIVEIQERAHATRRVGWMESYGWQRSHREDAGGKRLRRGGSNLLFHFKHRACRS